MKKIITILLLVVVFTSCKAQQIVNITNLNAGVNSGKYFKDINNNFTPFIGTWEYTGTNNITLRVVLHKTTKKPFGAPIDWYMDMIEGKYYLIRNADTIDEEIIHNSVKYYPQSGQTLVDAISGTSVDAITFNAHIYDNSVDQTIANGILTGKLSMTIVDPNASTLQAHWVITKSINIVGYDFNLPTDVILTKQF